MAYKAGDQEMADMLILKGASLDDSDKVIINFIIYHYNYYYCCVVIIELIFFQNGDTPLVNAFIDKDFHTVNFLIESGANVNHTSKVNFVGLFF